MWIKNGPRIETILNCPIFIEHEWISGRPVINSCKFYSLLQQGFIPQVSWNQSVHIIHVINNK